MALADLERRRDELLEQMASLGDMRRGSLTERYIPCGKPGCCCTKPGSRGHGPQYSYTRKVKGKTATEYIPAERMEQVREQIENRKEFGDLCQEFLEVNEAICDLRMEEVVRTDSKKNSSRRSKRRSAKKSSESSGG